MKEYRILNYKDVIPPNAEVLVVDLLTTNPGASIRRWSKDVLPYVGLKVGDEKLSDTLIFRVPVSRGQIVVPGMKVFDGEELPITVNDGDDVILMEQAEWKGSENVETVVVDYKNVPALIDALKEMAGLD